MRLQCRAEKHDGGALLSPSQQHKKGVEKKGAGTRKGGVAVFFSSSVCRFACVLAVGVTTATH
jgi:hypothetical protein